MNTIKLANERTTIYLDPRVKKTAQYYALRDDKSLSEVVNEQLLEYLEDQEDIAELEKRRKEPSFVSLEDVLKDFGIDEKELRDKSRKKSS